MLSRKNLEVLVAAQNRLYCTFPELPSFEQRWDFETDGVIQALLTRLGDNDPYFHPRYAGHMSGYVCDVAVMSYFLAMQFNPNNHSYDGGRATTKMEVECLDSMARMLDWNHYQGHLTSGGTIGNLEALWIHRELGANTVICSKGAHFTHKRAANILDLKYLEVDVTKDGSLCSIALSGVLAALEATDVPVVVCTLGTTLNGAIDPLDEIFSLKAEHDFKVHVDAAYGGYFYLIRARLAGRNRKAFDFLPAADSIVIDPHKHGLQGFGCGALLLRGVSESTSQAIYTHDSPYTYFDRRGISIGEKTLECSRPGAAAAALWATMQCLPLEEEGAFSRVLLSCHTAAVKMSELLFAVDDVRLVVREPALDIVVFYIECADISAATRQLYEQLKVSGFYVAMADCDISSETGVLREVSCIRLTLMKKEHLAMVDELADQIIRLSKCIADEYRRKYQAL